jgi:hypothetical protein
MLRLKLGKFFEEVEKKLKNKRKEKYYNGLAIQSTGKHSRTLIIKENSLLKYFCHI